MLKDKNSVILERVEQGSKTTILRTYLEWPLDPRFEGISAIMSLKLVREGEKSQDKCPWRFLVAQKDVD